MTYRSLFASGVVAVALALPVVASAQHGGRIDIPAIPPTFNAPDGNVPYLQTHAYGTQNYICLPSAAGVAWKLFGPQATLYPLNAPMQIATHFLSPNPEEQSVARATWQDAHDGSSVWARIFGQPLTDPNYVAPGAVAWLLLEKVGTAEGPIGGAFLAQTTFIHRLNTEGGLAPSTGCSTAAQIGATALVPYAADYFFYRAEK